MRGSAERRKGGVGGMDISDAAKGPYGRRRGAEGTTGFVF